MTFVVATAANSGPSCGSTAWAASATPAWRQLPVPVQQPGLRGPVRDRQRRAAPTNAGANFFAPDTAERRHRRAHAARADHEPADARCASRPAAACCPSREGDHERPIERPDRSGESGFTLVETLVAIVVLVFGLMAVTNLLLVAATSNTRRQPGERRDRLGVAGDGPAALDALDNMAVGGNLAADTTSPSPDCRALVDPDHRLQLRRQHPGRGYGQDALADHGRAWARCGCCWSPCAPRAAARWRAPARARRSRPSGACTQSAPGSCGLAPCCPTD